MNDNVLKHIDYFVSLAGLEGHQLTRTRIVKFLYLAEVLYLKNSDKRLTDWNWIFWDFGPFCLESLRAIDQAVDQRLITAKNFQSNFNEEDEFSYFGHSKDLYLYISDLENHVKELEIGMPVMVQMGLRSVVKKYSNSTDDLLNYVYYKTEPMMKATPRENLDFSTVSKIKTDKVEPAKISRNKEKKVREAIKRMKEAMLQKSGSIAVINSKHIDSDYILGMEALNRLDEDDEINEVGIASIASISKA
jgi:uncharacterized phage-associated protein